VATTARSAKGPSKGSPKGAAKAKAAANERVIATNRRARHEYEILEVVECGMVLAGVEVKAMREGKVTIADAHGRIRNHEAWLVGMHVPPYLRASTHVIVDADRDRKLLLHRHELEHLASRVDQEHLTLVPLKLYFKDGRVKLELALARGRKRHDKRQAIAERDASREATRAMARAAKGIPAD